MNTILSGVGVFAGALSILVCCVWLLGTLDSGPAEPRRGQRWAANTPPPRLTDRHGPEIPPVLSDRTAP